jgi:predicted Zn-ribbon and HTH transcriptional regulator
MAEEFWHDNKMDEAIKDMIDIFMNVEGDELVRLSGLTKRFCRISEKDLSEEAVNNIVQKFKANGVINYQYILSCPHCHEISYQIIERDIKKAKLCDTCKTLYNIVDGITLKRS